MFTPEEALKISQNIFGIGESATLLPGEQDFNFYINTAKNDEFLLKISHAHEERLHVLMQNEVLNWLQSAQQPFNYPKLQRTLVGGELGCVGWALGQQENVPVGPRPNLLQDELGCVGWALAQQENVLVGPRPNLLQNPKSSNFVRLFSYVPGTLFSNTSYHAAELLESLGSQVGHLCKALTGFQHPRAKRSSKWDLLQAQWIQNHLDLIKNAKDKACINYFLSQYESKVVPTLSKLRYSIIHGDINDYNTLVTKSSLHHYRVSGFIDFGDVIESATVCELAIATAYAILDKPDPITAAAQIIKGFHRIFPLEEIEIEILYELIAMRLCVSVVNSAIHKKPNAPYLSISEKPAWCTLNKLREINAESARTLFKNACLTSEIQRLRQKRISKNIGLAYNSPLHIVRGQGQYLFDENGRQFLDCVNNVCHVGHCHPKVVEAGQKQMAVLNTNTRYLHEYLPNYAQRLISTLPAQLEVCFFVCSGSEANELALRLAQNFRARSKFLVMEYGYHGNTSNLINISPYKFNGPGGKGKPDHVQVLPIPIPNLFNEHELSKLDSPNPHTAAFICESLLSCGGQVLLPENYLKTVYAAVRNVGGLCIADEVQVGLGRLGTHFWGFETQGVVPDIVTMGKPLGNGHPIGAVVTTREIADAFYNGMEYFNTFGGNPVSCSIGLSVLDVLVEEQLQDHAHRTGNYLKQQLIQLKTKHSTIKEIRGLGLFLGIELLPDIDLGCTPKEFTNFVINQMKERKILLSTDGPLQQVIKIKPPLVFTKNNCDFLVSNLDEVLKLRI